MPNRDRGGLPTLARPMVQAIPPIVLVLGLLTTAVVCENHRRLKAEEHRLTERSIAQDITTALRSRFQGYETYLSAVAGLFDASDAVSPEEFRRFHRSMGLTEGQSRDVRGLGFVAATSAIDGLDVEVWNPARDEGVGGGPGGSQGNGRGAVNHPTAVVYLEPHDTLNKRAIGSDLYLNPDRREAMIWSAMSGEPALTGPVVVQRDDEPTKEKVDLMLLPVFGRSTVPAGSEIDRTARVRGWTFLLLRTGPLIKDVIDGIDNPHLAHAEVVVHDGSVPRQRGVRFDTRPDHGQVPLSHPSESRFQIANRQWLVAVQLAHNDLRRSGLSVQLLLLAALGGFMSLLAALASRYLVRNHLAVARALQASELANSERALATAVFETSPIAILVTDPEGIIISSNNAFSELSGLSRSEAIGKPASILRSRRHGKDFFRQMWKDLSRKGQWKGEIWNRHRNNEIRRDELTIIAVTNSQKIVTNYVGMIQDVTERYTEQEHVRYQAMHDYLTGLPNRALLMEQLHHHLALARRYGTKVALMFLDLDAFKPVNDHHGHAVGDQLLQKVADRMQGVLRESDVLCRQGGDEYVLLIPEAPDFGALLEIARKLLAAVAQPYPGLPEDVHASISIGIARWPDHGADAESLVVAADAAMYRAKHGSGDHIQFAHPSGIAMESVMTDVAADAL